MKTKNKYYNANPLGKETSDCVVRAITLLLDSDWDTVYKDLYEIGYRLKVMPNSDEAWKFYMKSKGIEYHALKAVKGQKRMTVDKFTRTQDFQSGRYLLKVANHLVTCVDGNSFDIWDCSHSCVYGYWTRK